MTTALARQTGNPIQDYRQSLTPPDLVKHRAWIGIRVEALLFDHWQNEVSEAVRREAISDWMAILEPFAPAEIKEACRTWLRDSPRLKPRAGDIVAIIHAERARALREWQAKQPPPPEPEMRAPSEERRREMAAIAEETLVSLRRKLRGQHADV